MKKVGLIVLALVIALGALGAGYAYWTQDLVINGTVDTGEMSVIFTDGTGSDTEAYANTAVSTSGETATVTVTNAYPGYAFKVVLNGENDGTIPVQLLKATYTPVTGTVFDEMTIGNVYIKIGSGAWTEVTETAIATELPVGSFSLEFNFSFDTDMTEFEDIAPVSFNLDMDLTQFNDPTPPSF